MSNLNDYDQEVEPKNEVRMRVKPQMHLNTSVNTNSRNISMDKGGLKIVWTGPGYYKKFEWKGTNLYHRSMKTDGVLYRDKPQNTESIHVIDMTLYDEKATLESILKNQLLADFQEIGIKVTQDMKDWVHFSSMYKYQFFPALQGEQIVLLQKSDWRGCIWSCSHHTIVTIYPRLMDILYGN